MRQKITRDLTVIARYYIKKNHGKYHTGDVVLRVRNDKGVEYLVTVRPTNDQSCSCPSRKPCYHLEYCKGVEEAREAAAEQVLAAKVIADKLTQEVEAICAEVSTELAATPARELAPLNGNRPFSLLRR